MEEVSDTNIIISTVISGVLGSSLFAEEVEEYWGLLDSNSEDLWLSSAVDSSSWVITLSTVVAMLFNWARIHRDMRTRWRRKQAVWSGSAPGS